MKKEDKEMLRYMMKTWERYHEKPLRVPLVTKELIDRITSQPPQADHNNRPVVPSSHKSPVFRRYRAMAAVMAAVVALGVCVHLFIRTQPLPAAPPVAKNILTPASPSSTVPTATTATTETKTSPQAQKIFRHTTPASHAVSPTVNDAAPSAAMSTTEEVICNSASCDQDYAINLIKNSVIDNDNTRMS